MLSVEDDRRRHRRLDLPRIWDRFYRAERSRGHGPRATTGSGLGLAIVRGVVEAHGGSATVAFPTRPGGPVHAHAAGIAGG